MHLYQSWYTSPRLDFRSDERTRRLDIASKTETTRRDDSVEDDVSVAPCLIQSARQALAEFLDLGLKLAPQLAVIRRREDELSQ